MNNNKKEIMKKKRTKIHGETVVFLSMKYHEHVLHGIDRTQIGYDDDRNRRYRDTSCTRTYDKCKWL